MSCVITGLMHFIETHEALAFGLSVFSVVCFAGSIVALPALVASAPLDYFVRDDVMSTSRPLALRVVRNMFGAILFVAGLLMLVLPGQGLITILVSLTFLDIPSKRRLIRLIGMRPNVTKGLQWLRTRAGKPPFEMG